MPLPLTSIAVRSLAEEREVGEWFSIMGTTGPLKKNAHPRLPLGDADVAGLELRHFDIL